MLAMTTHHRDTGHTCEDRDLDFHVEDIGGIDIGPNNDNDSTNSSGTTIAFGELEEDGHCSNILHSNQANVTIHTREINSVW